MASFSDLAYVQRQLTIKTGVVKRLAKEESSYLAEARDQQIRIQKFIDQGKDEYDVKQQRNVLEDTLKMIPDCRKRLELAADELMNYVEGLQDNQEVKSTQDFTTAQNLLSNVQDQIQSPLPTI